MTFKTMTTALCKWEKELSRASLRVGVPHVQWEVHAEALGGLSGVGRWLGNKLSNLVGTQLFLGGHKQEGVASLWN